MHSYSLFTSSLVQIASERDGWEDIVLRTQAVDLVDLCVRFETIVAIELNRRIRGLLLSKCQEERRAGVFNAPLVNRKFRWHEVAIVCICHQERRVGVHLAPLVSRQFP